MSTYVLARGDRVAARIAACRFRYVDEDDLQRGICAALLAGGFRVNREVRLDPACRIDMMVDRVGVEVKVDGQPAAVDRQLQRYALLDQVDELILVTNRARHRPPATLNGKPVHVVNLSAAAL